MIIELITIIEESIKLKNDLADFNIPINPIKNNIEDVINT
jgi:hypothetical protein